MENSIVDAVKSIFQEDTLTALANSTGETTENVRQGLDAMIPLILLALEEKSERELGGILESARQTFGNFYLPETDTLPFESAERAAVSKPDLLKEIFGDNQNTISETLNRYLGLTPTVTEALLSASLPAVFSVLTSGGQQWETRQVFDLLKSRKAEFLASVPTALHTLTVDTKQDASMHAAVPPVTMADAIIDPTHTSPAQPAEEPALHTTETVKKQKQGNKIWWFLSLVILVALWVLFGKGCYGESTETHNEPLTELR